MTKQTTRADKHPLPTTKLISSRHRHGQWLTGKAQITRMATTACYHLVQTIRHRQVRGKRHHTLCSKWLRWKRKSFLCQLFTTCKTRVKISSRLIETKTSPVLRIRLISNKSPKNICLLTTKTKTPVRSHPVFKMLMKTWLKMVTTSLGITTRGRTTRWSRSDFTLSWEMPMNARSLVWWQWVLRHQRWKLTSNDQSLLA